MSKQCEEQLETEDWKALRKQRQEKKLGNQIKSTHVIHQYPELNIESKNNGNHLIVSRGNVIVDFWPSTGKWIDRANRGVHMRGVLRLLKHLGIQHATHD